MAMGFFGQRPEGDANTSRNTRLQSEQQEFRLQSRATKFVRKEQQGAQKVNPYRLGAHHSGNDQQPRAWQRLTSDGVAIIGTCILVIGASIYVLFGTQYFVVTNIYVNETKYVSSESIRSSAKASIDQRLLWFIPRNRTVTMWPARVQKDIIQALGSPYAVEEIDVSADYPSTMKIQVRERVPSIGWITKNAQGREQYYTIDRSGVVTEQFQKKEEMRQNIPVVFDQNRPELGLGWHVVSNTYVARVIELSEKLSAAQIPVERFVLPSLVCKEQEYIAEQIFAQEIANSETEEVREKKRVIQERFKSGELGIDESLNELEKLKQEEVQQQLSAKNAAATTYQGAYEWKTINKTVACDFVVVATDVSAQTQKEWGGALIRFDTSRSLTEQIQQLQQGLRSTDIIPADRSAVQSIDVRIPDRLYILKK